MKYKAGDKFIIEIESILDEQVGLYKVKGFRTLVFDNYGLDRLEQIHEHDGCGECRFFHSDGYPCIQCRNNYTDKWKPQTEEIQVGDTGRTYPELIKALEQLPKE